jgi:hypothetical protein
MEEIPSRIERSDNTIEAIHPSIVLDVLHRKSVAPGKYHQQCTEFCPRSLAESLTCISVLHRMAFGANVPLAQTK